MDPESTRYYTPGYDPYHPAGSKGVFNDPNPGYVQDIQSKLDQGKQLFPSKFAPVKYSNRYNATTNPPVIAGEASKYPFVDIHQGDQSTQGGPDLEYPDLSFFTNSPYSHLFPGNVTNSLPNNFGYPDYVNFVRSNIQKYMPSFKTGGIMPHDGMAYLHQGERVLNTKETKMYDKKKEMAHKMPRRGATNRNEKVARRTLASSGRNEGERMMGNNTREDNRS